MRFPKLSVPVWLFILFAFVVSVRLLLLTLSSIYPIATTLDPRNPDYGLDSCEYIRYAKNLALHGTFSHSESAPFHPSAVRTPIYPSFLAPFFRLASSDAQALLGITMAQICLAGINSLLLYAVAVRVTGNTVFSWAAAAMASLDLFTIRLSYMVATETLFITLLLATTLVFLRYLESSSLIHLAWSMVLLVCAGLCRPLALYFLPVFLLFVIWRQSNLQEAPRSLRREEAGELFAPASRGKSNHLLTSVATKLFGIGLSKYALKPVLVAISVFALCLTPWMIRNWCTLNYFTVYTNGSFMNAFLANGLLTVKRTGNPIPMLKLNWRPLDQMIEDSLKDLTSEVGSKVRYDANMRHLLGLDHPHLTRKFESILQSKADRILRENRLTRLKSSVATFLVMPFWTPRNLLCRLLGEEETVGISDLARSVAANKWGDVLRLISELRCCKILGYPWNYGHLICLNVFGLVGLGSILLRGRGSSHRGNGVAGNDPLLTSGATKSAGSIRDGASLMCWMFLAVMPFVLMAAPSWATAVGWEMSRFRAPAIPFIAIFAVLGFALSVERFRYRKTKHTGP